MTHIVSIWHDKASAILIPLSIGVAVEVQVDDIEMPERILSDVPLKGLKCSWAYYV